MSRTQFAPRNSAKFRVLRHLSQVDGYVSANRLMPLFNIRSYRNVYSVLNRLLKWELISRRNGTWGQFEYGITAKGRDRLAYYELTGVGA